jgi:diaminopimelate decarboxylase
MSEQALLPPVHAPASFFSEQDEACHVGGQAGGLPLLRLAARVGRTPFYAYDRSALSARVAQLRATLPSALRISYAMKANPMPAVVQHMAGLLDGLDVASVGEMKVALDAGMHCQHISFAGPGKSEAELWQAVAAGILLNLESMRELPILAAASQRLGLPARVAVRVNPDFDLKSSGMKMGGGPKQFGIDAESVPQALAQIGALGLQFEGFHIYAGSQNLQAAAVTEAQQKSYELALRLAASAPSPVRHLNLGGGFGIPYFPGDKHLDLGPIGDKLSALVDAARQDMPQAQLSIELGRYLVGEAGLYVSRVLDVKVSRGHVYVVTDGGLHHHLSASGNFGQVIRKNYPVRLVKAVALAADAPLSPVSVVGPLCTPLDLLGDRCKLPTVEVGDLVVIGQSGAYGASASPQGFLGHPAVTEVLV